MTRRSLFPLLMFVCLAAMGGCDGSQVVVFSPVPAGSDGSVTRAGAAGSASAAGAGSSFGGAPDVAGNGGIGTGGLGGTAGDAVTCHSSDDCDSAWYCDKQLCADPVGVCLPRPLSDDPYQAPVCGCDHRNYFNDTLRQQRRISSSTRGECGADVRTCMSNDQCGTDGSCSHQAFQLSDCSKPGLGQCWVMPYDCETTIDKPRWLPCPPPGTQPGSPLPPCITTCQAVKSGLEYLPPPNNACH